MIIGNFLNKVSLCQNHMMNSVQNKLINTKTNIVNFSEHSSNTKHDAGRDLIKFFSVYPSWKFIMHWSY